MGRVSARERIGVYGGTFDPPHLGHLILAETAADSLELARVLFVPAADPPHKSAAQVRASAAHRLAMVELAIAGNPRFGLSRVDIDRAGPHYSVDMLRLLGAQFPQAELVFLIGVDSLRDLPTWSRPQELLRLATLGVMRRPFVEVDLAALEAQLPGVSERIAWIDAPLIDIAARDLARRVACSYSIRYQVTENVRAYIARHKLYRSEP